MTGLNPVPFLLTLRVELEKHRYFQENADAVLDALMGSTAESLFNTDDPIHVLHDFQACALKMFPHSILPYGSHATQKQQNMFALRTRDDIDNEAYYNVVMTLFSDTARANMTQNNAPIHDIQTFEKTAIKLLAV